MYQKRRDFATPTSRMPKKKYSRTVRTHFMVQGLPWLLPRSISLHVEATNNRPGVAKGAMREKTCRILMIQSFDNLKAQIDIWEQKYLDQNSY